jgi:hypothetical protein
MKDGVYVKANLDYMPIKTSNVDIITNMNTHNNVELFQAGEALEDVKNNIQLGGRSKS